MSYSNRGHEDESQDLESVVRSNKVETTILTIGNNCHILLNKERNF